MGVKYLWDNNTVIYFLQNQFTVSAEQFIDNLDSDIGVSVITEIELMCWKSSTESELQILTQFLSEVEIFELSQEIKKETARIRKSYKTKLPDAIIAATAIINDITLLTRNVVDFDRITGLKIINPFDK
jgi:predicted nucleic acid-binding protein